MREIKFRGKRVVDGRWAYGYYVYLGVLCKDRVSMEMKPMILNNRDNDTYALTQNMVDFETVGQYTGLEDKNDKEIYEGDILIMHDGINGDYEIKVMDIREIADELKYYNKCAEIVRNIYEN